MLYFNNDLLRQSIENLSRQICRVGRCHIRRGAQGIRDYCRTFRGREDHSHEIAYRRGPPHGWRCFSGISQYQPFE